MKSHNFRLLAAILGIGLGMGPLGTADAWYYGPSYDGPYGPNAMRQDRQELMHDHGWAMHKLRTIFEGRRPFNRREATELALAIEAGAGENLWRLYSPRSVTAPGSRTAPSVWGDFESFKANAQAMKESADRLADALAKRPEGADYRQGVWTPRYSAPWGNRWGEKGGGITREAIDEFRTLGALCQACHRGYRGSRYSRW